MAKPFCDIIMKGGVTSGIVYPRAIERIAADFEFKNIGGTSAGAIAACLTAAAEYKRQTSGDATAFESVGALADELKEKVGGRSRLYSLFQPERATKHLFGIATSFMGDDNVLLKLARLLGHVVLAFWWIILITLLPLRWIVPQIHAGHPLATGGERLLVIAAAFMLCTVGSLAWTLLHTLPRQRFGLCSGGTRRKTPALMEWLDAKINDTANVDHPLTFADLAAAGINLRMVTTNLTHGRPYTLPFSDEVPFFFCKKEFERIFPKKVVNALIDASTAYSNAPGASKDRRLAGERAAATGLYLLPPKEQLPIVVAARMSLSFPVLFSVVPLWSIHFSDEEPGRPDLPWGHEPELCWFIDGGLTSNFPISLFDSPLPRWPTFGLDLMEVETVEKDEVWMIDRNQDGRSEHWNLFAKTTERVPVGGWLSAVLGTIRNWRDTTQMGVTGYRDRIAHIKLTSAQGGLNLEMAEPVIKKLADRGGIAGEMLATRFVPGSPHPMNWENHQRLRYQTSMALLQKMLRQIGDAITGPVNGAPYAGMDATEGAGRAQAVANVGATWSATPPDFVKQARKPQPELRQSPPF